jgi:hypothetical protein
VLVVALTVVRQAATPPVVTTVAACVDSGAARTFLPLEIAHRLGIQDGELEQDEHGGMGVEGVGFPTFTSTVPMSGLVMALIGPNETFQAWGPLFDLNPAFSEKEPLLLGRHDFFKVFTITFEEDAQTPVFHLEYA